MFGDKDRGERKKERIEARMRLTNEAEAVKSASASEMSCGIHCGEVCDSWNEADK